MEIKAVVLGRDDPEMRAIREIARACGIADVEYAESASGAAYRATSPEWAPGQLWVECAPAGAEQVPLNAHNLGDGWALCAPGWRRDASGYPTRQIRLADHHRPGDPGFGRPPVEFWPASSLGQVVRALIEAGRGVALARAWRDVDGDAAHECGMRAELGSRAAGHYIPPEQYDPHAYVGVDDGRQIAGPYGEKLELWGLRIPRGLLFTAAADHCLAAAYAGQCPGVDPDALLEWQLTSPDSPHRSEPDGQGGRREVSAEMVRERAALARLMLSPGYADGAHRLVEGHGVLTIGGVQAVDLRIFGGATAGLPISDVACRLGLAYLLRVREQPSGRVKIVLQGHGEGSRPGVVDAAAWEAWCRAQGLRGEAYGDSARGFLGRYEAPRVNA